MSILTLYIYISVSSRTMKLSDVIELYTVNNFVGPMLYTISFTFHVMGLQNLKISYICHLCVLLKQFIYTGVSSRTMKLPEVIELYTVNNCVGPMLYTISFTFHVTGLQIWKYRIFVIYVYIWNHLSTQVFPVGEWNFLKW